MSLCSVLINDPENDIDAEIICKVLAMRTCFELFRLTRFSRSYGAKGDSQGIRREETLSMTTKMGVEGSESMRCCSRWIGCSTMRHREDPAGHVVVDDVFFVGSMVLAVGGEERSLKRPPYSLSARFSVFDDD